jgi:hypothetical protein
MFIEKPSPQRHRGTEIFLESHTYSFPLAGGRLGWG